MKRYIYLLAVAALAVFGCTVTGPEEEAQEYAGNRVKVTLNDNIPVTGGSVKATVQSEIPFTVSIPEAATWLTAQATDTEITFTAATANESAEMRYASVALIDAEKGFAITRFDVCQDGVGMAERKPFEVSTKEINVEAAKTTATFDITTEVAWTITSSNEAFVVTPASGEGNATVTVTFPANEGIDAVVAELSVAAQDPLARPKSHTVVITQASAVKTFEASIDKTELEYTDVKTIITVESDVAWTATTSNEGYYLVISGSGDAPSATITSKGNQSFDVLVPANFGYDAKTTTITIVTDDALVQEKTKTFTVSQKPYTIPTGQVIAEWYFATSEINTLKQHYDLAVGGELADVEGFGDVYIDANSQGVGKFQYWQVDKRPLVDKEHKRVKRTISTRGEPLALATYTGDYILWTANPSAPLPAGTKVHLFFALRPQIGSVAKYWKVQYLDGNELKPAADYIKKATTANGEIEYTHELFFTEESEINTFVDVVVTLTAETPVVQFKIECVDNTMCDGTPWGDTIVNGAWTLRFAGWDSGAKQPQYCVHKRPVIEVVQ